ncbi:MAG: hypothetical protein QXT45_01060 [Candidatus Bilamarchaeaceae archaeon]
MKGYSIGETLSFSGIVISARPLRGVVEYVLHTGKQKVIFSSSENLEKGQEVELKGQLSGLLPLQIAAREVGERTGLYEKIVKEVEEGVQLGSFIAANQVTQELRSTFLAIAKRLASAKELNRFTLLRFHGDADGIAGALALNDYMYLKPLQQNSAVYAQHDVVTDISLLYNERRPLVVLLDFGSNERSARQLELLRASGAEVILIDHHPLEREIHSIPNFTLSPWLTNASSPSSYTAGYLAAELVHLLGIDSARYARIACAGDKSHVCEPSEEDRAAALVLDYLATHTVYGNNLMFYRNVLRKNDLFLSIHLQAKEAIDNAAEKALAKIKQKDKAGFQIYLVPLAGLTRKGEFPNKSKITSAVLERVKSEKPTIIIGWGDGTIILRANKECKEKLDFSSLISRIIPQFPGLIKSGGGHALAAAIHVNKDYEQPIIDALLEAI